MSIPKKFVILDSHDLAIINGATGVSKLPFVQADISSAQTVTFDTDNPCVAVIDNNGLQWDLGSKRVWYSQTGTTIDLTDVLYAKGLISTPATLTTASGTYERYKPNDTESGYSWKLKTPASSATNIPPFLYTEDETPTGGDPAYISNTATGNYESVQSATNAIADDITGTWYAVFVVSTDSSGGTVYAGLTYTPVD